MKTILISTSIILLCLCGTFAQSTVESTYISTNYWILETNWSFERMTMPRTYLIRDDLTTNGWKLSYPASVWFKKREDGKYDALQFGLVSSNRYSSLLFEGREYGKELTGMIMVTNATKTVIVEWLNESMPTLPAALWPTKKNE